MNQSLKDEYTDLLSMTVHEFRSPLTVVGGYLRMLLRGTAGPLNPHQLKLIEGAAESCGRLAELCNRLSEIGKLDDGREKLVKKPIELWELVADVAAHVHEARDRDVHLALQGDADPAPMSGDAQRLRSAFDAVFRAIVREKAGPATVVAERRRDRIDGRACACVIVADADAVQESYARPRYVFNEKRGGVALELSLARRVFEGHGGRIWAPAPVVPAHPETGEERDPLTRGSAIIVLPLTE